ncbi:MULTISPECIES: hypothetical protein [Metabacillus]|uniref:hypothetical protein n=1 Tax=Metabacillus TaxID=2675233 RepID=UPI000C807D25|nr:MULTISPECIES: hypothetical protein [Metabacillus]MCM3443615.1 hypothetical protein [Metabacillus halosaccharovorans]PMC34227.1 hypothetical protein CJ195_24215 [Bacillus sp. UMB0899]
MGLPQEQHEEKEPAVVQIAKDQAKKVVRNQAKKVLKKIGKKAAKLALKAVKQAIAMLAKMLLSFFSTIGLPATLIILGIVLVVIVFMMASSYFYGGDGEGLSGVDKEIQEYVLEQSHGTVDMSRPEQRKFRVPEKLIASVIQIDSMIKGNEDPKKLIQKMATVLKPNIDYGDYNEYKETETTVCRDGKCGDPKTVKKDNWVSKISFAEYWDGNTDYTYTPYLTNWVKTEKITYETEKYKAIETYTESVPYTVKETYYETETYTEYETYKYTEVNFVDVYGYTSVKYCDFSGCRITQVYGVIGQETVRTEKSRQVPITKTKEVQKTKLVTKYKNVEKQREVIKERQIEIKTIIRTRYQKFNTNENAITDYSRFDEIMNEQNMGATDKKLIEALYASAGGQVTYTEWLGSIGGFSGSTGFNGTVIPGEGVPTQFMQYYLDAQAKYGVDWFVLSAIHFVETGFSTHETMVSSVGAIGPLQFMPATARHVSL